MARYVCPNQYRHPQHRFLMCKALLSNVPNVNETKDALIAYCPYQKYCSCSHGAENTEQARECYQNKMNQTANAD